MKRILLIDDNEAFRRPLSDVLERAGHEVINAAEGARALSLLHSQAVDLVITDLIMPGKEGLETILEVRKLHPALKIIAISGGGRINAFDYLQLAEKLGAVATLAKPFTAAQILEVIDRALAPVEAASS